MTYYVITCDGYRTEATVMTLREAITRCIEHERQFADGFARLVSHNGRIVADAEGSLADPGLCTDAATQTGMYDHY